MDFPRYLARRPSGLTFLTCVSASAANPELVRNFDRLQGTNLSMRGAPLDLMIDQAAGRLDSDVNKFLDFVWEYVFTRLP
jgi:hypothetical protein